MIPKPEIDPDLSIAVIIPAYRVQDQITWVLNNIPVFISNIIIVNDASPDNTQKLIEQAAQSDPRVIPLRHETNQGVGGAMLTGFAEALSREIDIVVKVDGDGQMDPAMIQNLIAPLLQDEADFTKGNRFRDFKALKQMPTERLLGNVIASLLAKITTGYWYMFDPANGFIAMKTDVLRNLDLNAIARDYFFETSLLCELYNIRAVVRDVPMPAKYGDENSSVSYFKMLFRYPIGLIKFALKRFWLNYIVFDFNLGSIYTLFGIPLFLFGFIFGLLKWIHYAGIQTPAPTGTVLLAALSVLLAVEFIIQAVSYDLRAVPKTPISRTGVKR